MRSGTMAIVSRDERVRKWRELAQVALRDVEFISDPDAKAILQSIASEYTALADMADAQRLKAVACAEKPSQRTMRRCLSVGVKPAM
jgi:hypothetical protein